MHTDLVQIKYYAIAINDAGNIINQLLFCHGVSSKKDDPPKVIEPDETHVIHLPPSDQLPFLGIDCLEEAIETLHAALRHQAGIELQDLRLEKLAIDIRIKVRLFAHQFRKPFKTSFSVHCENSPLDQAMPNLTGLWGAKPQLAILQKKS